MTVMILILAALLVALAAGALMVKQDNGYGSGIDLAFSVCGFLIMAGAGAGAVCYAFTVWSWFASDYKASIINREYSTSYTREEVFFASDVIDTVRELDRKRVEVNGDVFTGKGRAK